MRISNFQHVTTTPQYVHATVDVTTGFFWWKKTTEKFVSRPISSRFWLFTETGVPTPYSDVEDLERAYCMRKDLAND